MDQVLGLGAVPGEQGGVADQRRTPFPDQLVQEALPGGHAGLLTQVLSRALHATLTV